MRAIPCNAPECSAPATRTFTEYDEWHDDDVETPYCADHSPEQYPHGLECWRCKRDAPNLFVPDSEEEEGLCEECARECDEAEA